MNSPVRPLLRAADASAFATGDLCGQHRGDSSGSVRVLPAGLHDGGAERSFCGAVLPVNAFEDKARVKVAVDSPSQGRMPVVDR